MPFYGVVIRVPHLVESSKKATHSLWRAVGYKCMISPAHRTGMKVVVYRAVTGAHVRTGGCRMAATQTDAAIVRVRGEIAVVLVRVTKSKRPSPPQNPQSKRKDVVLSLEGPRVVMANFFGNGEYSILTNV